MASATDSQVPNLTSYETALCVFPPSHLVGDIERLRALYDKAYGRWAPHINLIYPFVAPEMLTQASEIVQSTLAHRAHEEAIRLRLDRSHFFAHRRSSTIYLTDSGSSGSQALTQLRRAILDAFGCHSHQPGPLHLTVGQSEADNLPQRQFLVEKAALLPAIEWEIGELVVLIRDRSLERATASCPMEVWGRIPLSPDYTVIPGPGHALVGRDTLSHTGVSSTTSPPPSERFQPEPGVTFQYNEAETEDEEGKWVAVLASPLRNMEGMQVESSLTVSSYNVLIDSPYPPPRERYPILLQNLLSTAATTDILVLQEVSDEFLSFLLKNNEIRMRYKFTTHGPPDQADISPLSSLRNIVVLSRWLFHWEWLPFEKRHKGAVVLQFDNIGTFNESKFSSLVVTGVHLSCGLSDSSILAKRFQLQSIIQHLSNKYSDNYWVLAGDLNITTSSYTIDEAVKRKSISPQAVSILSSLDYILAEAGLSDCYFASRAKGSGSDRLGDPLDQLEFGALYEGEEGATFDPTENDLAARVAGQSFHCRPQRYDRIFVRGEGLEVLCFNRFGFSDSVSKEAIQLGSDHWGVRAELSINEPASADAVEEKPSIDIIRSPPSLGGGERLMQCLYDYGTFPSATEIGQRQDIVQLTRDVVNQRDPNLSIYTRLNLSFAVVPVGSYGLGVWNSSSDIDLLVIGQLSSRTFFMLMVAKLRKATHSEIKILRKVKAASGTMLELEVRGVRVDLQYCAATRVIENWPHALDLPVGDPTFELPMQSLLKLNPLRDMHYLQRTVPDVATFRLAYRFIKLWAQRRGIYSAKLGYLGGVHITLLLSRVCKLSFHRAGPISAVDMICTFFRYYARFQWDRDIIYDPGFYKKTPRYFRISREPVVILTQNAPKVNVARAASVPSARTLEQEFKRIDRQLTSPGITWTDVLGSVGNSSGVEDFLTSYPRYAKVNVQYWGAGAATGRMLLGWLEWRCVSLLVDINRKFPDLHARIWPARFTEMEEINERDAEYQGCFLIGLTKGDGPRTTPLPTIDRQSAETALLAILNTFAEQIRGDENYYDASSNWVDVDLVSPSGVRNLHVDRSALGNAAHNEDEIFDDDDDEINLDENENEDEDQRENQNLPIRARLRTSAQNVPSGTRLRPASDILSRLRWDANIDIDDYVIGYDDRFLGDRELPAGQWKAELTDEAFIPMHRILYFRRKSDGFRVWDRETKTDLLFNSGASSQGSG
ncbi:DUF455 domain-containing protein [Aspergillus sclerotialis]|uniref:polynucleotide adenylyltransferase n=1 Tax=Aspergillus sclerotialis TaxID=2070753 RepID=A0A3A2ZBS6_9EURO|nr:DUF455 domain-containing protein [Aspergillus sclerotialis]